ncbi:MAG: thioredoxin family protein [Candidatus Paceibacterota bacterium]
MKLNRWKIATMVLAVVSIVLAVIVSLPMLTSAQSAADKAIVYVNKFILQGNGTATLSSVDKETIEHLRKITLDVDGKKYASYVSVDGKYFFTNEPFDLTKNPKVEAGLVENTGVKVEGGFDEAINTEVCLGNGKPIVYFFGSTTCPHCQWEKPIIKEIVGLFGDAISYHENIDTENDKEVFSKYSEGSIPTIVIGCKYYRVGSGEKDGIEAEKAALKSVICKTTGNLPASVCQ